MTSLRIALAYFSFVPLQRWLNWLFGLLLCLGLLFELLAGSTEGKTGAMVLATVAALIVAAAPGFGGGLVMRMASTPVVMHLRPQGRHHMLGGATLAIVLVALLMTLPLLVFQSTGAKLSSKALEFSTPALGMFQTVCGGTALAWVFVFALSRHQAMVPFSFILLVAISNVLSRLVSRLPITADQLATGLFATGIAAWIAFAIWYLNTASIGRSQPAPAPFTANPWRGFLRPAMGSAMESRAVALSQHLIGSDSFRGQLWRGAFIAALCLVLPALFPATLADRTPLQETFLPVLMMLSALVAPTIVRRTRLLWLRGGMDRAALFTTAERHAGLAAAGLLCIPGMLFVTLSLIERPDLVLNVFLFTILLLTFVSCLVYAGLSVTRGWNWGNVISIVILGLLFIPLSSILQPHKVASAWSYLVALAIFGTLALLIRWIARRAWLILDWRVAGLPLLGLGQRKF